LWCLGFLDLASSKALVAGRSVTVMYVGPYLTFVGSKIKSVYQVNQVKVSKQHTWKVSKHFTFADEYCRKQKNGRQWPVAETMSSQVNNNTSSIYLEQRRKF
jgi:starvation-inducible outer membrane lipoprotein